MSFFSQLFGDDMGEKPYISWMACSACGAIIDEEKHLHSRPVKRVAGATEYGLVCPRCEQWHHTHFDTPDLQDKRRRLGTARRAAYRGQRQLTRYRALLAVYRAAFDEVQERLTRESGVEIVKATQFKVTE